MSDKRELILESAFRLFTTRGFHNTPTSLIAKEAGVANGTLFNLFKSKETLINQLYLTCKISLVQAIQAGLNPELGTKDQLFKIWQNSISWAIDNHEQYNFFQQYSNSPFIQNETREEGRLQFSPFISYLEKGMNENIIKQVPMELLMGILMGIINSSIEVLHKNPEKLSDEAYMNSAFNMLWDSVRT